MSSRPKRFCRPQANILVSDAYNTFNETSGRLRARLPVNAKSAFATAGRDRGVPGSPLPSVCRRQASGAL